jgi:hypothetical protein
VSRVTADGNLSQGRQAGVRFPWLSSVPCLRSGCITSTVMIVPAGYPSSLLASVVAVLCCKARVSCLAPALVAGCAEESHTATAARWPDSTDPAKLNQAAKQQACLLPPLAPAIRHNARVAGWQVTANAPDTKNTPPCAPHLILKSQHLKLTSHSQCPRHEYIISRWPPGVTL